jgi:cytidylate kinase
MNHFEVRIMPIVTISRGSASGGLLLAEGLAKQLGFDIVGREEIIQRAASYGVPETTLEKALLDPPGFWDRFKHDRRRYLIFIQEALCERAQKDNLIYHGTAGHLLLRCISHVVRIRLIAPVTFRIQMLVEREKMTRDQAAAYIKKIDAKRSMWTQLLYGVNWLDPELYDLVINLETMNLESCVEVAAAAINRKEFSATSQSRKAMDDLCLITKVKAALAADPATAAAEVEVEADSVSGKVSLLGKIQPPSLVDTIVEVAGKVTGVARVDRDGLDAPDYTV